MQSNHRSTERVLNILELLAFRDASDGLTLTEISNSLQSPKSSISPILHTMAKKKYLSYKPESSTYTLGIRTLEIGNAYMRKESFFERALTELQEVVDACNETCHLAELDGCNVLYLLKVDAPQSIRIRIERRTHSIAESLLKIATVCHIDIRICSRCPLFRGRTGTEYGKDLLSTVRVQDAARFLVCSQESRPQECRGGAVSQRLQVQTGSTAACVYICRAGQ